MKERGEPTSRLGNGNGYFNENTRVDRFCNAERS